MYPGFKELIEEKSEISLGASYWDAAVDEAVNPRLPPSIGIIAGLLRRLLRDGHNFGASAPGPALMREYGLTAENVCKRALALMEKNNV